MRVILPNKRPKFGSFEIWRRHPHSAPINTIHDTSSRFCLHRQRKVSGIHQFRPPTSQQLSSRRKFVSQIEFAKTKNNKFEMRIFPIILQFQSISYNGACSLRVTNSYIEFSSNITIHLLEKPFCSKDMENRWIWICYYSVFEYLNRTKIKRRKNTGILKCFKSKQQRSKYVSS